MYLKLVAEETRIRLGVEEARSLASGNPVVQAFRFPGGRTLEVRVQGGDAYRDAWSSSDRLLTIDLPRQDLMAMLEADERGGLFRKYGDTAVEIDLWDVREKKRKG